MGQSLSEPVTKKQTAVINNRKMVVASSCMQGWRISMEDAHTLLLPTPGDDSASFFGVFDGHGGSTLAQYVSKNLHNKILQHLSYKEGNIKSALINGHLELDLEMSYDHHLREDSSGTTSITVIVKDNILYCANVGDSRAIASKKGQVIELSHDHKPSDPIETNRITAAGGFVEFNRVNGNLALSRALGDFVYKKNTSKAPEQQMVSAYPDVTSLEITSDHEFVVMACDGIWDVMTNFEVLRFVRKRIAQNLPLEEICEELLNTCLAPDCRLGGLGCDNMTVLIICFLHGKRYSDLAERCNSPLVSEESSDLPVTVVQATLQ